MEMASVSNAGSELKTPCSAVEVSHRAENTFEGKNVEGPQNKETSSSLQVTHRAENTSKGKNVERSQNEESSSVQDIPSVSDPPVKCFDSKVSLEKTISSFEENTTSNFIILQISKNFGNEDFKASGKERILWRSPNVKGSILISFTGVPYLIVGRKSLQCHLGKDLNSHKSKKNAEEIKNQTEDHCFRRRRRIIQNTKKMGCTAEIHIIHILRFPDFKIAVDTEKRRKIAARNLKLELQRNVDTINFNHEYVAKFPRQSDHVFHVTSGEVANLREKVDVRVKEKIMSLHKAGVRKISEMRRHIHTYVSTELLPGSEAPVENRRRYYPTRKDMCNIMAKSKSLTQNSSIDQCNLLHIIHEWQTENSALDIHCRPSTASDEDKQAFLFCYQTEWQKRLLQLYGHQMTLFDATYRTTRYALPLFFLCVRTNVCYVVVGAFVTQFENAESIEEALRIFKSWNKTWNPLCFLVDFCLEEINAITHLFPDSKILLCDFHREKAWMEWLSKKNHNVRHCRKQVLKMLRDIANAGSIEDLNIALQTLKKSTIWKENEALRQWLSNKWLPEITKWARAYRHGILHVGIHTNNGIERQHEILKYNHLDGYKNCSLSEMITVLHCSFFPNTYKKYVEQNVRSSQYYRKYKEDIPSFQKNRPREIIVHIIHRLNSTLDQTDISIVDIEKGLFMVNSETNKQKKYNVSLGGTTPFCTCSDWRNFLLPCKHICSIFKNIDQWGWRTLSQSYTKNPLFLLDVQCLSNIIKEDTWEGHYDVPALQLPPTEEIEDLTSRRRSLRTKMIRNCNQLVKKIVDSIFLIKDINSLCSVEGDLEEMASKIKALIPEEGGLPLIQSPKRKADISNIFEPLPKRLYGRPKHPASQRVGTKADFLREDVWVNEEEDSFRSTLDFTHREENDTWVSLHGFRLTNTDKSLLENNEWLDDNIINVCQLLISKKFPHVHGLYDTLLVSNGNVDKFKKTDDILQIHHTGNHWLLTHGSTAGVRIYDSLRTSMTDTLKKQLIDIYYDFFIGDYSVLHIECLCFQKQIGANDCGAFAIANAVSLAQGLDLSTLVYDQSQMRAHLIDCIEQQEISVFPHSVVTKLPAKIYSKKIALTTFCLCKMHQPKEKMVECSECTMWYHLKCVGLSKESQCVKTKRKKYHCPKCT